MKTVRFILVMVSMLLWSAGVSAQTSFTAATLPLKNVIEVGDRTLAVSKSEEIRLPPLPAQPGSTIILRFRAVSYCRIRGGANYGAAFTLNGAPLGRFTEGGRERLVGRSPAFRFAYRHPGKDWQVFSGPMLWIMFAPDIETGDGMTRDGQAATFALDISDAARGVDGNLLKITNTRKPPGAGERDLIVRGIEIGWLDKNLLPKEPNRAPQRKAMKDAVSMGALRLAQGQAGGFSVGSSEGVELLVETALGMERDASSDLIACDVETDGQMAKVAVIREGPAGYRLTAVWPDVTLVRTLRLANGILNWKERWTNMGKAIIGAPFRHRLFLRGEPARFLISGNADANTLAGVAQNPTVFLGSRKHDGDGVGVTMESDWLRLLARLDWGAGVGEIYTQDLALPPGGSIDFALTVTPVRDGGGYWSFINRVRRRWGVNGGTVERPFFWNWAGRKASPTAESLKKAFGHLGPVAVTSWLIRHPWARLGYDQAIACSDERYPKLPEDAPRTPGKTPDLDLEAFLTFAHREPFWKEHAEYVALVHRVLPDMQVVHQMEPAIEVTYLPMAHRWPYAEDAIRTAAGDLFQSPYYKRAFLGDWADKDWTTLYYVPRSGSAYLEVLLRDVGRSMDDCGGDGMYIDEFTWAGATRGYCRYDYSRWDGYSADLDAEGKVVRLKSDNAFTTESAQIQLVEKVRRRNGFFLGNGAPALRSVNNLRAAHFVEGGNGPATWAKAHLSTVPLVLGNFGYDDPRGRHTRKGAFQGVKMVLERGCIYSPHACNLALDGPDNFVSKLYPITIRTIGPGLIEGEQRLITTHSGAFNWPGRDARVALYVYDENGDLVDRENLPQVKTDAAGVIDIAVPPEGLVIAEIR